MQTLGVSKVILDFDLYPRASIDSQHVGHIAEAYAVGTELPPIIVDRKSKRAVDGFHRVRAYIRVKGSDALIPVVYKTYKSEGALFLDAMRYNANHGRMMSTYDRTHCIIKAHEFDIKPEIIASTLHMAVEKVGKLWAERTSDHELRTDAPGARRDRKARGKKKVIEKIAIKQTIKHKAGKTLTKKQVEVNEKLQGMPQSFYVNQLIMLVESDLLDVDDEDLMLNLARLCKMLKKLF